VLKLNLARPWTNEFLAHPSCIAKSALFAGLECRGQRPYFANKTLETWGKTTLEYKGELLDQFDLRVWMAFLNLMRKRNSRKLKVSIALLGHEMRINCGGRDNKRILNSIFRLCSSVVKIDDGRGKLFFGNLLRALDDELTFDIPEKIIPFVSQYSLVFIQSLEKIGRNPLAQKLNTLFSTQDSKGHSLGLDRLAYMTGWQDKPKYEYRRQLKKALTSLERAAIINGGWSVEKTRINYTIR